MKDTFNRDIYYLRISVTDLCNLRCAYCMPEEGVEKLRHADILSVEEIEEIVRAAAECGIRKVRVTGGEPLVRRGIVDICRRIATVPGTEELCVTTNGTLLTRYAADLKAAGVDRLNISLDTLDPKRYSKITRGGKLEDAIAGIGAAINAGFEKIKINTVLIGGVNDSEIQRLVDLTKDGVSVRFIELMPVGECADWSGERFVANTVVLAAVPELVEVGIDGVSRTYRLPGACGTVGLISPISSHFCQECNRVRVTSDGKLKPCLHSPDEINLRGLHGEELLQVMHRAIGSKPQRHHLEAENSGSLRNMNAIGG